ncbi:MAG TPA: STAS domain-containing protein [Solirubrobacteraceae bacterium]
MAGSDRRGGPARRPFKIEESEQGGRARLVLAGQLDLATAPELESALTRLCESGIDQIEIDLGEIDFIDSMGLRAILLAKDSCAKAGIEFFLVPSRAERHRGLFEATGLRGLLSRRLHRDQQVERAPATDVQHPQ